jgi:hypothetical protein
MVQTGAKTQFGGLKEGFTNVGYQVVMLSLVTIPDKYPTNKQVDKTTAIRTNFCIFVYILYKYSKQKVFVFVK